MVFSLTVLRVGWLLLESHTVAGKTVVGPESDGVSAPTSGAWAGSAGVRQHFFLDAASACGRLNFLPGRLSLTGGS